MKLLGQIWTAVLNHIQMESHWLDYSFLRYVNSTMINLVQSLYIRWEFKEMQISDDMEMRVLLEINNLFM